MKAQFQEQKIIQSEVQDELQVSKRVLFEKKAIITSITRVPPEVLGVIFTVHVWENEESPWDLMHVSRAWRVAALITRSMWGRILIAPSGWVRTKTGGEQVRVYNGMEVCHKECQLSRALKRAGAIPLDLMVVFSHRWMYHEWETTEDQLFDGEHLIDVILSHQPEVKLCSVKLIYALYGSAIPPRSFERFNYAYLTSLTTEWKECPALLGKVAKEARGLRSLYTTARTLQRIGEGKWWGELEYPGISNLRAAQDSPSITSILLKATALKSLYVSNGTLTGRDEDETAAPVVFPSLKRLELTSILVFWPVECTNITHLILIRPPYTFTLGAGSICLPNLIELSFECKDLDASMISVLTFLPFASSIYKLIPAKEPVPMYSK